MEDDMRRAIMFELKQEFDKKYRVKFECLQEELFKMQNIELHHVNQIREKNIKIREKDLKIKSLESNLEKMKFYISRYLIAKQ